MVSGTAVNGNLIVYDMLGKEILSQKTFGETTNINTENFHSGWHNLISHKAKFNAVTLAEARTNDGQRLLAFNDFFIGPASHTSARYKLT